MCRTFPGGAWRGGGWLILFLGILLFPAPTAAFPGAGASGLVHHDLEVEIRPNEHRVLVRDRISVPENFLPEFSFILHRGLEPYSPTPGVLIERQGGADALRESFRVVLPPGLGSLLIEYGGPIHHPLEKEDPEYARGFMGTPGIISEGGVHLSGQSAWYPILETDTLSFALRAKLPGDWDAVSQGRRSRHLRRPEGTSVRWDSPEPQEEIYLIAAPFIEYGLAAGPVRVMAFLRGADESLAGRYLETAASYLAMYEKLIAPYPYSKFALVENFWETGWGMPSFTLLGPKVIRFPFILHTSYPHEILHNWWGNGVYPDYSGGNWSEGLTAYLADHLIKEQGGKGADYRRASLQKYLDYVGKERDFPLAEFRSRHSSTSEAIGYGKSLMFFHMLRERLGDDAFLQGLRDFCDKHWFRRASYSDLRNSFEETSRLDLAAEFDQWVSRAGAPELRVVGARAEKGEDGHLLKLTLEQIQAGEPYKLRIPLATTLEGEERAHQTVVSMGKKRIELNLPLPARPLRIDVDPEFDIFRKLDHREVPPALSHTFGAEMLLLILPSAAEGALLEAYRGLASSLGPGTKEVRLDSEVESLPPDRAVAILGWENRFLPRVSAAFAAYGASIGPDGVLIKGKEIGREGRTMVLSGRNPEDPGQSLLWVGTDLPEAMRGLGRKLPHYHKYSYLGFEGREPTNTIKGRWSVPDSPMTLFLSEEPPKAKLGSLAPREPLAGLPPAFSERR